MSNDVKKGGKKVQEPKVDKRRRLSDEDWRGIEIEYRKGVLTVAEIARKFGCSPPNISKMAKKQRWVRDLNDEIQAKARAIINAADRGESMEEYASLTDKQIVDDMAAKVARVQQRHRIITENLGKSVEQIVDELIESKEDLFARARILQMVASSFKVMVDIERKSYGMDTLESKIANAIETTGIKVEFVDPPTDDYILNDE